MSDLDDVREDRAEKIVRFESGVWQAGFTIVPNIVLTNPEVANGAFRVYALLLHYAREDDACFPGQDGLATQAGMGERTVRDAIRALEEAELVRTQRRGLGRTNIYTILEPRSGNSREADSAEQDRRDPPIIPSIDKTQIEEDVRSVSDAWRSSSPPLLAHRDAYLTSDKTKRAIDVALKVYPAADVAGAIRNYATVLAGSEYRWDYKWTLVDFLKRGLDRFVDEAEPLRNFRRRSNEPQRPSASDFPNFNDDL